jgi:hypothetical protein
MDGRGVVVLMPRLARVADGACAAAPGVRREVEGLRSQLADAKAASERAAAEAAANASSYRRAAASAELRARELQVGAGPPCEVWSPWLQRCALARAPDSVPARTSARTPCTRALYSASRKPQHRVHVRSILRRANPNTACTCTAVRDYANTSRCAEGSGVRRWPCAPQMMTATQADLATALTAARTEAAAAAAAAAKLRGGSEVLQCELDAARVGAERGARGRLVLSCCWSASRGTFGAVLRRRAGGLG